MKSVRIADFSIKIWLVITGVLMAMNLFFALTLMHMAPQVSVLAQLLTPNVMNFGQAIEATDFDAPVGDKTLIEEMLVRFYIEQRAEFIPDVREMMYRWGGVGPVRRLSTSTVYNQFIVPKGDYEKEVKGRSDTQSVHIRDLRREGNIFTINFDLYKTDVTGTHRPQQRRAVITIAENRRYRHFGKDFINPFGTIITKYDETKVVNR